MSERKPLVKPKENPTVVVQNPAALFSDAGKTFSLRRELPVQTVRKTRDWKQIACDFLSETNELEPLSQGDAFSMLDTSKAGEFVAGGGMQNWNELRKEALDSSKEKVRKSRKQGM